MNFGYECHEIGGPWIAENPDCPIHGESSLRGDEIRDSILGELKSCTDLDDIKSIIERIIKEL